MKKNNLLILLALASVGCSKSKDYPTLLSELEKQSQDEQIVERKLANLAPDKCMKDVFSLDMLKAEIKGIEKQYLSGTKVTGKWKHLNLEELPIPQANFLKAHGSRLGDLNNTNAFDYSDCKDLPCVINKIYGKPDSIAGYVHYLWYLKMGNYLTAHNTVYGGSYRDIIPGTYNGKEFAVSAYLWSEDELYAFWRLSHMIKAPHTQLKALTEIQRVPRGEYYGFMSNYTCGLAWSHGLISLQDGCLPTGSDLYPGTFYESVLHELTHQVDYHEGRKNQKTYRSGDQDYLDVSGFFLKEYKDDTGKMVRQWEHKPGTKLVTSYAGTSPAENFAETIAHFRVNGTVAKTMVSTAHWDYTSKNYFNNKHFDKTELIDNWIGHQKSLIAQLAFKAVGNCSKSTQAFASTYFKKTDFLVPLLPAMINCLGVKATEISKEVQAKIKVTDPDGCQVLSDYNSRSAWEPILKPEFISLMNKYLNELKADKTYFAKVEAFHNEIPKREMANQAFLSCSDINTEEACYEEGVLRLALEKIAPLNLPAAHAQDLAELYLSSHPLEETRQNLNSYYKSFVASNKAQIDLEANDAWEKCSALPISDELPPTGNHFTVTDGYMVSSIYNCINIEFPDSAKSLVRNMAVGDLKVQHPKEELILHDEVVPELKKSFSALYVKKKEREGKAVLEYIEMDNGKLRKQQIEDFSWVKDVLNTENINQDCQKNALSKISFPLRYQLKNVVFSSLVANACKEIHATAEYSTWLEESKSAFADKSVSGLENRILELAQLKAKECLEMYPVNTNLSRIKFKKEREACLLGEWAQLEATGIKEFQQDPLVIKFKVDINTVKSQLEINRRRLQLKVIKENF